MDFERTRNYIYKKCVDRVDKRRIEKQKPQIALCPDDKSLVSHFFNGKCTTNNPYLVNKRLINTNDEKKGIISGAVPILGFKDEFEVLWGDEKEFKEALYPIFKNIMFDLVSSNSEYNEDIETVLCDYITYSKYSTLLHIKNLHNISLLKYFGVLDTAVSPENMHIYLDHAIKYLYSKDNFSVSFEKTFYEFANKQKDYKFFDHKIENNYVIPLLIPLIKDYKKTDSLGLRVKKLIESDISKAIEQIDLYTPSYQFSPEFKLRRHIINASSSYIVELENISELCEKYNIHL